MLACALAQIAAAPAEHASPDPFQVEPSPIVAQLLDDTEKGSLLQRRLALFHGRWDLLKDPTPRESAWIALQSFQLDDPLLNGDAADTRPRYAAEAALHRGDAAAVESLIGDRAGPHPLMLRAEALDRAGRRAEAASLLANLRGGGGQNEEDTAEKLTALGRGVALRAAFEGRPAQDYHAAMELFAAARQKDHLYWPAPLAEAELLLQKDNMEQAAEALASVLAMNPKCARAWSLLGGMALRRFDFELARSCAASLRDIHPDHLLADLLDVRTLLTQRDPRTASAVLQRVVSQWPHQRTALALQAAAHALQHDMAACRDALEAHDALSPGSPRAHYLVGSHLAAIRQYAAADAMLRLAIERDPNWPEPLTERGLLLLQWGHAEEAHRVLSRACDLDPFQVRAANSLTMVEALTTYDQIRTEHFIIRYGDPSDAVLARDMARKVDAIYDDVTEIFEHTPRRPTSIEIMPSKKWFAVRITGMPSIWTFAACTGDVIAVTPPKYGKDQQGPFDWVDVIRHEFVHTVTLDQTDYRIPHWFTEACAVSTQRIRRDFDTCRLLAASLEADELFPLDQINWAFVRPKRATDRALAYAQSDWMIEFLVDQFGHRAVIALLRAYREGTSDETAMEAVTQLTADDFFSRFKSWAAHEVRRWGLAPDPRDAEILDALADGNPAAMPSILTAGAHHRAVLKLTAELALESGDHETARRQVLRYAEACPVDPWPSRALVRLALDTERDDDAIGPMQRLDTLALKDNHWARELGRMHRRAGRFRPAAAAVDRALQREPYDAALREEAAAIALQAGHDEDALFHIESLTLLEPQRSQHWIRLAAMHHRLRDLDAAHVAAEKARTIDPEAPVERFLKRRDITPSGD